MAYSTQRARGRRGRGPTAVLLAALLGLAGAARAEAPVDLLDLSLEELMEVEVVSVTKSRRDMAEIPAAVYVLTADDIRRAGVTHVPELLRRVPGMDVARINAHTWAVSARGFNDEYANKLLVLQDGRSLYDPLYAGVEWDAERIPLERIERIEIVRGPGGTLWGANAGNGVIQIITRKVRRTPDLVVRSRGGNRDGEGSAEADLAVGPSTWLNVHADTFYQSDLDLAAGGDAADGWRRTGAGFRLEREAVAGGTLELHGDAYRGGVGETLSAPILTPPYVTSTQDRFAIGGHYVQADWRRHVEASEWTVRTYVKRAERDGAALAHRRLDTVDAAVENRFPVGAAQEIVWGLEYRRVHDRLESTFTIAEDPARMTYDTYNAFLQDQLALPRGLRLTVGALVERNDFTAWEVQPGARLLWRSRDGRHAVWGAASRAVRVPARGYHTIRIRAAVIPGTPPTLVEIQGNPDLRPEYLSSWEAGYRFRPRPHLSLDTTVFLTKHQRLLSVEAQPPALSTDPPPLHLVLGQMFDSRMDGESWGLESAADWRPHRRLRVSAAYTLLRVFLHAHPGSTDAAGELKREGEAPQQQLNLGLGVDLPRGVTVDTFLYAVDQLPGLGVPGYVRWDLRAAWPVTPDVEVELGGTDLLSPSHLEALSVSGGEPVAVPRTFYGGLRWRF